jgi:hypothetical protein
LNARGNSATLGPRICQSESGNAGTWTLVKAEEIQANRFKIAAIRHNTSLGIPYTARVAWAAIGKRILRQPRRAID